MTIAKVHELKQRHNGYNSCVKSYYLYMHVMQLNQPMQIVDEHLYITDK